MYFDTHVHLNDAQFDVDRDSVLAACRDAGVERLVEIADAPADWEKAIALSRARPFVRASLGLHPYHADQWPGTLAQDLPRKAALPEVVAVGEIGLDYVKSQVPRDVQRAALLGMLALAREADKPVVIHCRGAYEEMMPLLEESFSGAAPTGRFHGVLHCFSGGLEDAARAVKLGFALGVDGPVTYPKNDPLRAALREAGLDSLVLETDAPYLPPQSSRGKRNDPRALPEIAASLAKSFGVEPAEVARRTTANALSLYRLSGPANP